MKRSSRGSQRVAQLGRSRAGQSSRKRGDARVVAQRARSCRARRAHALDLHRPSQSSAAATVPRWVPKPISARLVAERVAAQLADVQLAAHLPISVAAALPIWRVVRPDHRLGARPAALEQARERLEHVRVAQIPASRAAVIHDAVIVLRGGDQAGVLRGVEQASSSAAA